MDFHKRNTGAIGKYKMIRAAMGESCSCNFVILKEHYGSDKTYSIT